MLYKTLFHLNFTNKFLWKIGYEKNSEHFSWNLVFLTIFYFIPFPSISFHFPSISFHFLPFKKYWFFDNVSYFWKFQILTIGKYFQFYFFLSPSRFFYGEKYWFFDNISYFWKIVFLFRSFVTLCFPKFSGLKNNNMKILFWNTCKNILESF